ncbi:MAG: HEAT repeat domain-containing protein [Candidatus Mariimomonas ferrooxydans]
MEEKEKEKEKEKKEKLPLDAKLLSDAVIELNISRRSVGLYPSEHPITKKSIESAYSLLKKLFEIRSSITLGVAKDVLMVDEYTLDRKNPVFIEFATALHSKGIAAITFYSGLEGNEVLALHELISDKDLPVGQALIELDKSKKLRHVRLEPLEVSKIKFVEGVQKGKRGSEQTLWEDYVYGVVEGTLADGDAEGIVFKIPPEDVASILSSRPSETQEGYDRVITTYLSKKGRKGLNKESMNRFMTLVENLSPNIKEQFLSRTVEHPAFNQEEAHELLEELTPEDVERIMKIFEKQSVLPESLRNLIERFSRVNRVKDVKGGLYGGDSHIDDIELSEEMMKLFEEDKFEDFVDKQYQKDLEKMLEAKEVKYSPLTEKIKKTMNPEVMDSAFSAVILELTGFDRIKREDYLKLLTRLSELTDTFLETGRFEDVLNIRNTIYSQTLTGNFRDESSSMVEYFFHSEQFVSRLLEVFNIWGREQREHAFKLVRMLKLNLVNPMLDALSEEERPSQRKFYLSMLSQLGRDVLQEAVKRLGDERWYVIRNMIYLIREIKGKDYISKIRPLIRHKNEKVCIEALKTLVHFNTPDASSNLKLFLTGKNPKIKEEAIKLSGSYRMQEAVPYLINILEKQSILGEELHYKTLAVKALGKIGDPSALNALRKLYSSKSLLYKGAFREIKLEIIRSLDNYPFEQAGPIIELALVSGDDEAKTLAKKLISKDWNA